MRAWIIDARSWPRKGFLKRLEVRKSGVCRCQADMVTHVMARRLTMPRTWLCIVVGYHQMILSLPSVHLCVSVKVCPDFERTPPNPLTSIGWPWASPQLLPSLGRPWATPSLNSSLLLADPSLLLAETLLPLVGPIPFAVTEQCS